MYKNLEYDEGVWEECLASGERGLVQKHTTREMSDNTINILYDG